MFVSESALLAEIFIISRTDNKDLWAPRDSLLLLPTDGAPLLASITSRPHTGSCGGSGSGRLHDGGPCRRTALLSATSPGSASGCCCSWSVRPSPPPNWSGPPPPPPCRPPPSSPQLPEESSRSAGRPEWPSPERAARRRGGAGRPRVWARGRLEERQLHVRQDVS